MLLCWYAKQRIQNYDGEAKEMKSQGPPKATVLSVVLTRVWFRWPPLDKEASLLAYETQDHFCK